MLAKFKLDTVEVLIFKALIGAYVNHDEFSSVNNKLRDYHEMKKEFKNPQNVVEYTITKWKSIVSVLRKIQQTKVQVS